jgi:vancomycin resistance protein VanJ
MPARLITTSITVAVWLYLAFTVAVWLLLRLGGDRWWFPTLMLFGPRWFYSLPLAVLVPIAAVARRHLLWPLAAAGLVVVGPVMGFCLPWARLVGTHGPTIRVLTCNLKGHCMDNVALEDVIRTVVPDIVALQGCCYTVRVAWPKGWHVCQQGELLVASRFGLRELAFRAPDPELRASLLLCQVAVPGREVGFCTLHPESPHHTIDQVIDRRTVLRPEESPKMEAEIEKRWRDAEATAGWLAAGQPEIVAGDFNLPPDSAIYQHYWSEYGNAFAAAGLGFGYTEIPPMRRLRFGIRIDHILAAGAWRPRRCWVGPDVGSDHLPLIADLEWRK